MTHIKRIYQKHTGFPRHDRKQYMIWYYYNVIKPKPNNIFKKTNKPIILHFD